MERLTTDSVRLTLAGILLTMLTTLFSNPLSAKVKGQDFTSLTPYEFDFSGIKVGIELPGGLDKRFPKKEGVYHTNIYDSDIYNGMYADFRFLERWWDYRGYFWQGMAGRFGVLALRINLVKSLVPNATSLREDLPALREAITKSTEYVYQEISEFKGKHVDFQLDMTDCSIRGLGLVRAQITDSDDKREKRVVYYLPLTDQHYVSFMFSLSRYGDDPFEKWEKYAIEDIEKIMQTLSVQNPPNM
jgi:hypothetical protein